MGEDNVQKLSSTVLSCTARRVQPRVYGRDNEVFFGVLTDLQNHDTSLEIGGLFQQDGFVKIVQQSDPHPQGLSGTGSVGSVTVTT